MSDVKPTVAVLKGGRSAEREISLVTGAQVEAGLAQAGFPVVPIDTGDPEFIQTIRESGADVAFICLHGRFGEDGTIQGLLELLDMPYVGCGVLSSALAMDKAKSKEIFVARGVPTPGHACVRRSDNIDIAGILAEIGLPNVVKPVREGSSIGMTIVHEPGELPGALDDAFDYDDDVLVEEFVEGVEVTVGVLGTTDLEALPTLEIVPAHEFYDFESKYEPGMCEHIIPARISDAAQAHCARAALEAHRALQCRGMSRVDLIVKPDDTVWVLEVNTIPGMTPTSLLPDAARAAGIEFPALCERLVIEALDDGPAPAC